MSYRKEDREYRNYGWNIYFAPETNAYKESVIRQELHESFSGERMSSLEYLGLFDSEARFTQVRRED